MKFFVYIVLLTQFIYANESYYCYGDKKISIVPLIDKSRSIKAVDYYQDENGHVLGVSDKLIVAFKDSASLQTILENYKVTIVSELFTNTYLLKVSNKKETLSMANTLNELSEVLYAHPDFLKKRFKR